MIKNQVYPEVAVGTFIFNSDGDLLMVKTYKWPDMYSIPGGHVELGESIAQTAVREAREETGLKVKFKKIVNMQEAIYPKDFIVKRHFIFVDVLCTTDSSKVRLDGDELQEYMWIKPEKALRLRLNTYTRKAINDIIKGKMHKR